MCIRDSVDPDQADASALLFGIGSQAFFLGRPPRPPVSTATRRGDEPRLREDTLTEPPRPEPSDDFGRWQLLVQHQSGSLDAAVARARRQNLAISFGVLLLLTVSLSLIHISEPTR